MVESVLKLSKLPNISRSRSGSSKPWVRTLAALLVCAACASSEDKSPGDDSGAVTQGDPHAAGHSAPGGGEQKPSGGTGGSAGSKPSTPAASGGSSAGAIDAGPPVMIEKPSEYDAGTDPDRNKVMPAQLCQRIAEINCAGEAFCCDSPGRTLDACKQDLISQCSSTLMLDRIAMNPIAGFDAAAAEKAYTGVERRASKCDITAAMWGSSADGLRGILKGTVEAKASCMPTSVLDPMEIGAALLSCAHPETNACVYTNILDAWTCEPRGAMGGPCVTDNNCSDGFYCLPGAVGAAGSCGARKPVGESCQSPSECASLFCKKSKCVEADKQAAYCLMN